MRSLCYSHSGSRRAARGVAWLLAFVGLAGQLFGYLHLAQHRHVTCAEHGELVEAGDLRAATPAPSLARDYAQRLDEPESAARPSHEHCSLVPMRRERSVARLAVATLAVPACHEHALATAAYVTTHAPIAILHVAPKSSPPV